MMRTTLLLFALLAWMPHVHSQQAENQELKRLHEERVHSGQKEEPEAAWSMDRAPYRSNFPGPGYLQKGPVKSSHFGYAWNVWEDFSGIPEGPVKVNIPGGELTSVQYVSPEMLWMTGGDITLDTWYAVSFDVEDSGLYSIDTATGDYTLIGQTGFNLNGLAYDPVNDIMYAAGYEYINSKLFTVNLQTAELTYIGDISPGIIIGIAADINGQLYGLNLMGDLYSINSSTGAGTVIGPIGVQINYAQDIGFDRDNDVLYGTLYSVYGMGGFYELSVETGAATLLYEFGSEVCALAIPFVNANAGAPGAVSGLTATAAEAGQLQVSLSWTNPSVAADGQPLTELSSIIIERNGTVIETISDPVIGGAGTYTDNDISSSANYTYMVYGTNAEGDGIKATSMVYAGFDVPAAVGGLELVAEGNGGRLTWNAPTTGLNGGYFTGEGITYSITRFPDMVEVAANVSATSYLDSDLPGLGIYYYSVVASNAHGQGGLAASNNSLLGAEGMVGVAVGTSSTIPEFRAPFDLYYENSLAQTIYYPEELNGAGGALSGVIYRNSFSNGFSGEEVRIYAGVTQENDLTAGFLGPDIFTLVFQGVIAFPEGENDVLIQFDEPFIYSGGNLVLMTNRMMSENYGDWNDKFFATETWDYQGRMRVIQSGWSEYDPMNPPSGGMVYSWVPNTTLLFNTTGMGSLAGTVTDADSNPLEGVKLAISGTSSATYTNNQGEFIFPFLQPGQHTVVASLLGYADASQQVMISEDQQADVSLSMTALNTISVSGFVASDENPSEGLEGALVRFSGYGDFQAVTGGDGNFQIDGIYAGITYNLNVSAAGHIPYAGQVFTQDVNMELDDIILEATDIVEVAIGDGDHELYIPFSFLWNHSLAQTVYYPEEIGLSGGKIAAIQYTNDFDSPLVDRQIRIWMGETESPNLYDDWIDPQSLQLVFDGLVDFPAGVNEIYIELDDPFIYYGGNLVVYTSKEDDYWSGSKVFMGTSDNDSFRSRLTTRDDAPFDPMNIDDMGYGINAFPNTSFFISTGGFGSLQGTVTDGASPVEGVKVNAVGTSAIAYTDASGHYQLPTLLPGNYDIEFSLFGYFGSYQQDVVINEEQTTTLDVSVSAIDQYSLSGIVKGNDDFLLTGAGISLQGYSGHVVLSGSDGAFFIDHIYEGLYEMTITRVGYADHVQNIIMDENIDLGEIILTEQLINPPSVMVDVMNQDPGKAMLMWNTGIPYFADSFEDGTFDAWERFVQGPGIPGDEFMQAAYWWTSTVSDDFTIPDGEFLARADWGYDIDTWLISPKVSVGSETTLTFSWYSSYTWSVDPNPNAELMIKVSFDEGMTWEEIWNWQDIGVWDDFIWYQTTIDMGPYAGGVNMAINLVGNDNAITQIDDFRFGTGLKAGTVALSKPVDVIPGAKSLSVTEAPDKIFLGHNVYLDNMDTPYATGVTSSSFLFSGLEMGDYVAGVQAVYTTGVSEIVTVDFTITEESEIEYYDVTFKVNLENYNDFDPDNDVVYIAGIMNWEAPGDDPDSQLMEVSGDDPMIYTKTFTLEAGVYEYKYFLNAGWDGGEWAGGDNRSVAIDDDMIINDIFGGSVNVPEIDQVALKLFPNPASTILNVVADEMIKEIRMIDMLGQVVYSAAVQDKNLRINIGQFNDGIYFVQILTTGGMTTQRVQIVR